MKIKTELALFIANRVFESQYDAFQALFLDQLIFSKIVHYSLILCLNL